MTIRGDAFSINGRPTYAGRTFSGKRIEWVATKTVAQWRLLRES